MAGGSGDDGARKMIALDDCWMVSAGFARLGHRYRSGLAAESSIFDPLLPTQAIPVNNEEASFYSW